MHQLADRAHDTRNDRRCGIWQRGNCPYAYIACVILVQNAACIRAQVMEGLESKPQWFLPQPESFEIFGVDFLPDANGRRVSYGWLKQKPCTCIMLGRILVSTPHTPLT